MRNCIKKVIFCSFFTLLFLCVLSQELTFKMDNPRIIRMNNKQWFQFNVYVKASDTGTYLYSSQLAFNVAAPANFITSPSSNIFVDISQGILNGNYYGTPCYTTVKNWGNPATSFGVAVTTNIALNGVDPSEACAKITTSFQKIVTIGTEISNPDGISGTAGITFSPQNMPAGPGQVQNYAVAGIPLPTYYPYTDPNLFEGYDFSSIFLSRIFSNIWGWSQYGGSTNNVQYLDWSIPVNTSVWDSTATIDGTAVTNKLRVHNTAQFIIDPGAQVNCFDSVDIDNLHGLWIRSTPSSTGSFIDNGIISCSDSGSTLIDRYLSQDRWHGYCLPVNSTNTHPFLDLQLISKWYDEPVHTYHTIVNPAGDSILNKQMLGYFVYSNSSLGTNSTISVTGTPNTGDISIPVTATMGQDGPDGWNLIGNPYPSGVIWPSMILSEVDPTMYIFDPQRGNYIFWNSNDVTHTTNISPIIPAMQGFYVHCHAPIPGIGSVAVNNGMRVHDDYSFYKSLFSQDNLLILSANGNDYRDEAQIWFNDSSTPLFDWEHDVYKRWGSDVAPQLYSELPDSNMVTLDVLPWAGSNMVVPMGYKPGVAGTDTIIARNMQSFAATLPIWIKDLKENRLQELTQDSVYIFQSTPADTSDRFRIYFRDPSTGIPETTLSGGIEIYSFDKIVYVKREFSSHLQGDIFLFDMTGREVFSGKLKDILLDRFYPNVNEGCYLVKVISTNTTSTQKVFLN